jgi:uncharacterized protein
MVQNIRVYERVKVHRVGMVSISGQCLRVEKDVLCAELTPHFVVLVNRSSSVDIYNGSSVLSYLSPFSYFFPQFSMGKPCNICLLVKILVIVGALNWGLVGGFNYNVVDALLGVGSMGARVVYVLVGLAGVVSLACLAGKGCKCCKASCSTGSCAPKSGGSGAM